MFTGFASENTPAIQVWDFFSDFASTSAFRSVSLPDDCAPIQFFRTGATTTAIQVYLPSAPIEGKQIQIVNQSYANSNQRLQIRAADNVGNGTTGVPFTVGPGASITLVYCKNSINYGVATGNNQTGWLSLNFGSPTAGNFNAVVVGNPSNIASANSSSVLGGTTNSATGSSSAVVGGSSNTASNTGAAVIGGQSNTASNALSIAVGGTNNLVNGQWGFVSGAFNIASGTASAVIGGSDAISSNTNSVVVGGSFNRANAEDSVVLGTKRAITRSINPMVVIASGGPLGTTDGTSQTGVLVLGRQTTDATATRLTSNSSAASTTNQVILPNNSAYYVKGSIIATVTGGGNTKSWDFIATIKRGANAAATSIVGAVTLNVQAADAGAATWVAAITADTTNGGLAVTCTGQASTTIRWVAKLESTEVTY
jgi:hypothetical protein